jgi:hypothetical protein
MKKYPALEIIRAGFKLNAYVFFIVAVVVAVVCLLDDDANRYSIAAAILFGGLQIGIIYLAFGESISLFINTESAVHEVRAEVQELRRVVGLSALLNSKSLSEAQRQSVLDIILETEELLPERLVCPHCETGLKLDLVERSLKNFPCPSCGKNPLVPGENSLIKKAGS